jgi:hypothetical protein
MCVGITNLQRSTLEIICINLNFLSKHSSYPNIASLNYGQNEQQQTFKVPLELCDKNSPFNLANMRFGSRRDSSKLGINSARVAANCYIKSVRRRIFQWYVKREKNPSATKIFRWRFCFRILDITKVDHIFMRYRRYPEKTCRKRRICT